MRSTAIGNRGSGNIRNHYVDTTQKSGNGHVCINSGTHLGGCVSSRGNGRSGTRDVFREMNFPSRLPSRFRFFAF